jgi:hypothetical protein
VEALKTARHSRVLDNISGFGAQDWRKGRVIVLDS